MIDISTAEQLLDFGARIGPGQRAQEQLQGAVALHNILQHRQVAYLADEVGMGKTYVALGALALFRHFNPSFRMLVIAPRQNIQMKWMKEMRNFVKYNVKFEDLRVKAIDKQPVRELVSCENLVDLVQAVTTNPDRDFFARMTSFSLPAAGKDTVDPDAARDMRDRLREHLPWLASEIFDLRDKQGFKDNIARAICCAMPKFDLVIVDEGHNLKHGFAEQVAARNRVMALVFGNPRGCGPQRLFPNYAPKAQRVLFLSATPVEETYAQLYNQLDVFGLGRGYEELKASDVEEERQRELVAQFLIRRVTTIRVNGQPMTKNLYRREWRQGGVQSHDDPLEIKDDRQRLVVALVQKKVAELLGHVKFGSSFQIGMLASFESFLETAKVKRCDEDTGNFDDAHQTDDELEREGVDVADVNTLARDYRKRFNGEELPHPKMDAVVRRLSRSWEAGEKSLVFVRRVASVKELKRKLDYLYDDWLIRRLERELPAEVLPRFQGLVARYKQDRKQAAETTSAGLSEAAPEDAKDTGGSDTFFAWFFRGEGPRGVISGANIQQRFIQRGTSYSTFFEDNYVAHVLDCDPMEVSVRLSALTGKDMGFIHERLREGSRKFLGQAKKHPRADRFEAVQAAAIEWLTQIPGAHQDLAGVIWHTRFERSVRLRCTNEPPEIGEWLQLRTFFTELKKRTELRAKIWPTVSQGDLRTCFRERQLRAQLLSATARLGHAFIDLYVMTIRRLGSLELRAQESDEEGQDSAELQRISEYLDLLDQQRIVSRSERKWRAFDELDDIAEHFDLILDVNEPEARQEPLSETARRFGQLLGRQQPVGGMAGEVNKTLVRQFRMPGYPLVLITTDLLQEGEDLHTFCSSVHHYGISWTSTSMEQRVGRVDRVRSQADRRLSSLRCEPSGDDKLQVYLPHLRDTVEVLQVQRVLERMNTFLLLMHQGLVLPTIENRKINVGKEIVDGHQVIPQITQLLQSAFPCDPHLNGEKVSLAVAPAFPTEVKERFIRLTGSVLAGVEVQWETPIAPGRLLGTATIGERVQPFTLLLKSLQGRLILRCISPVGRVSPEDSIGRIAKLVAHRPIRLGLIQGTEDRTYDLTVEADALLADDPSCDTARLGALLRKVTSEADWLEQKLFVNRDSDLGAFRADLEKEGANE